MEASEPERLAKGGKGSTENDIMDCASPSSTCNLCYFKNSERSVAWDWHLDNCISRSGQSLVRTAVFLRHP